MHVAIDKSKRCRARLALSTSLVLVAFLRVFTTSDVFSGNATMYYSYTRGMLRSWLLTGSFAALAAVVVVPVFWQGSKWQLPKAGVLFVLAALVLFVCASMIREY
jgi:hypothetical protein